MWIPFKMLLNCRREERKFHDFSSTSFFMLHVKSWAFVWLPRSNIFNSIARGEKNARSQLFFILFPLHKRQQQGEWREKDNNEESLTETVHHSLINLLWTTRLDPSKHSIVSFIDITRVESRFFRWFKARTWNAWSAKWKVFIIHVPHENSWFVS